MLTINVSLLPVGREMSTNIFTNSAVLLIASCPRDQCTQSAGTRMSNNSQVVITI